MNYHLKFWNTSLGRDFAKWSAIFESERTRRISNWSLLKYCLTNLYLIFIYQFLTFSSLNFRNWVAAELSHRNIGLCREISLSLKLNVLKSSWITEETHFITLAASAKGCKLLCHAPHNWRLINKNSISSAGSLILGWVGWV